MSLRQAVSGSETGFPTGFPSVSHRSPEMTGGATWGVPGGLRARRERLVAVDGRRLGATPGPPAPTAGPGRLRSLLPNPTPTFVS